MINPENPFVREFKYVPFDRITIENLREAIVEGLKEAEAEIETIVSNPEPPSLYNTIVALEESGACVERASTVMYNLLSACASEELHKLSQEMAPLLAEHANNIALNEKLFERVKCVKQWADSIDFSDKNNILSEEDRRMIEGTFEGFERSGATLPEEKKVRFREVTKEISTLSLTFSANNLRATNAFKLHLLNEEDLAGLPETIRDQAAQTAREQGLEGWVFSLHGPSYGPFMTYSERRDLRKKMFYASTERCTENSEFNNFEIVRKLVNLRLEMAQMLGYSCYAEYVLQRRMAGSIESVYNLLDQLIDNYTHPAKEEWEAINRKAKDIEGENFSMKPWDFSYYSHKLQMEKFNLDSEMLRPYLSLQQVIDGVFNLANTLYGISFSPNNEAPLYHPDVRVFDVIDSDGTPLALLYTDFHSRESKQGGAWMTCYKEQFIDENEENHIPHVSIVMNFSKATEDRPVLLTLGEVGTLLHEFGHALHGMFSKVRRRNMGGTNVYWDFVELPSQFMENYLLEPAFLNTFARHYESGEQLPQDLIDRVLNARHYNVAYGCMRQVSFGLLDMAYYTLTKPLTDDIREFENQAWKSAQISDRVPESCMSVQFGHIMSGGYSAGYYSYKWSEVLDADAFAAFQEEGIFNKDTANRFRQELLSKGNTREPMELYLAFRGRKPTIHALLKRDGIK